MSATFKKPRATKAKAPKAPKARKPKRVAAGTSLYYETKSPLNRRVLGRSRMAGGCGDNYNWDEEKVNQELYFGGRQSNDMHFGGSQSRTAGCPGHEYGHAASGGNMYGGCHQCAHCAGWSYGGRAIAPPNRHAGYAFLPPRFQ